MRSSVQSVLFATGVVAFSWSCSAILGIEDAEPDPLLVPGDTSNVSPLCHEYCDAVMANCTDEHAVYVGRPACEAVCGALPPGNEGETAGNTVHCRLDNALQAETTGEFDNECPAAGPGGVPPEGAGICGSNCESYCLLFQTACNAFFAKAGFADLQDCQNSCASDIPDLGGYDTSFVKGDSVQCRLYHVSVALLDPTQHCPHAAGESPCIVSGAGGGGGDGHGGRGGGGGG